MYRWEKIYPEAQFEVPGYQYSPYREDRNKNGSDKIVFIMEDLITNRLKAFEGDVSKTICLEDMISKKVWFFIDFHRVIIKTFFSKNFQIPWVSQQGNMRTLSLLTT